MARSRLERNNLKNVQVVYMNAARLGFPAGTFDLALCGFMGWDDCFDFARLKFTRPETKASEILRTLRKGGRFICCSWEMQEDVTWMEAAVLRHHPSLLKDQDYLEERPIGMSYEKLEGYKIILRRAGFREIETSLQSMTFVSTDEEEWWRQMRQVGWYSLLDKMEEETLKSLKEAIFMDLQAFNQADGIYFNKSAFYISGTK